MSDSNEQHGIGFEAVKTLIDTYLQPKDNPSSLTDSVDKSITSIKDSYGNKLLGIGNDDKEAEFNEYSFTNDTLNWPLWLALYNDSWVFKRAIDKPAQDEIRCGIQIETDTTHKDTIQRLIKAHRQDFIELLQWGALFGGSVAVCMFDNFKDEDYAISMANNNKKLTQSKTMRMYVVDRWYGVEAYYDNTVSSMKSLDYGKPKFYKITFANGHSFKVHHDYILRYEHRTAPKLVKQGMLQGWGYAEGSHILNELMRDDKLKTSIQSLVDKSLIEVIKMAGMRGIFLGADKQNEDQLRARLEMVNWGRNFNSLTFLDKDDDYQEHAFSGLGGLSDLLQQNMWQISAALEMQGVLFGDLKQGFANDADALERYDETILNRCEAFVRPVYDKFLYILYNWKGIDEKIEYTFNSLLTKKHDKEQMESVEALSNLLSKLLQDGIIDVVKYAKILQKYTSKGVIDFSFTEDELKKIEEESKVEMEGVDLDDE